MRASPTGRGLSGVPLPALSAPVLDTVFPVQACPVPLWTVLQITDSTLPRATAAPSVCAVERRVVGRTESTWMENSSGLGCVLGVCVRTVRCSALWPSVNLCPAKRMKTW